MRLDSDMEIREKAMKKTYTPYWVNEQGRIVTLQSYASYGWTLKGMTKLNERSDQLVSVRDVKWGI